MESAEFFENSDAPPASNSDDAAVAGRDDEHLASLREMAANPDKSDADWLEWFFGTADLEGEFGTDDPVEILARLNLNEIVGTGDSIVGFEEEAEQFKVIVRAAKDIQELADRHRRVGSLKYLAFILCKSERQIREYCKAGIVPGAYQTAGGHWRIDYQADTVKRVRAAIGEFARKRTEPRLLQLIKEYFKKHCELPEDELMYSPAHVAIMKPGQYDHAAAVRNLALQEKKITFTAIAKMTCRNRKTVSKKFPGIKLADKISACGGSGLVDESNDKINKRKNRRVVTESFDEEVEN